MVGELFAGGAMGEERDWGECLNMVSLHMIVEGYSEMRFGANLLAPYLGSLGVYPYNPIPVLTGESGSYQYRGGLSDYGQARQQIRSSIKQRGSGDNAWFTTMFDLYGLPNDFPGYDEAFNYSNPYERVKILEQELRSDISCPRFIPYIQLHEFEALIFADAEKLRAEFPGHTGAVQELSELADGRNPEEINDGFDSAPSKRITRKIPEYGDRKSTSGPIIAGEIGLSTLLERCKHFREWIKQLKSLSPTESDR